MNIQINLSLTAFVFLFLFLVVGCTSQQQENENLEKLGGTMMVTDSLFEGSYFYDLEDDCLIMRSYNRDSLIQILKVDDTQLKTLRSMVSKGQGPYDVNSFDISVQDSIIWLLDFSSNIQKCFTIDYKAETVLSVNRYKKIPLSEELKRLYTFGPSNFECVGDSCLLILGGRQGYEEFFSMYYLNSEKIFPLAYWPNDGFDGDIRIKQSVYLGTSRLFKCKGQNRFLYQSSAGQILVLFDVDGNEMKNLCNISCNYPHYEVREDGLNYKILYPTEESMQRYYVAVSDNYIYVKVSPNNQQKNYKGYPFYYGDYVMVYDWNGTKVKDFVTDKPFSTFVIDDDDEYLYTELEDLKTGEVTIYRYDLNLKN